MKIKRTNFSNPLVLQAVVGVCFFFALLVLVAPVAASGPWKWRRSLTGDPSGNFLVMPSGLYVDEAKERYYVVDDGNNRLLAYDRDGKFVNSFDAGGSLKTPYDMTRDRAGRIWVVEKGRNSLTSIDMQAHDVSPHTLRDQGRTVYPDRLQIFGDNLLVLDKATGTILEFDQELHVTQRFGCDDCGAGFVDFSVSGETLWALQRQGKVYGFPLTGGKPKILALANRQGFFSSLAIGPAGRLYLLDRHDGSVAVYDDAGAFKYSFLAPGQARGRVYYPVKLLFDPWGNLCVVDEGNGRVQIFSRQ